jgi:LuxR family maltose regulon positive regulatory protein
VSAPAGFGKTTLLSEWIQHSQLPAAWLSLDKGDNNPARFLAYLSAALEKTRPAIRADRSALLQSIPLSATEPILTALLQHLDEPTSPFALILDDYHTIDAPAIHEAVSFLFDHLPAHGHLVIAGRSDPPLPLARLRGRDQLIELRAAELMFTPEEAATFLNGVMNLDLTDADVAALEERTEGWIVGLQMAALSMRDREDRSGFIQAFTGSHRFVLDYLIEEVLDRQTPALQEFLLKTSILDR